jgi:hypothetical protein
MIPYGIYFESVTKMNEGIGLVTPVLVLP